MSANKENEKRIVKRILVISGIVLLALCLLVGAFVLVSMLLEEEDLTPALPPEAFFSADYSENIFEDPAYMSMNRAVYFKQYGSGEQLTEENYLDYGECAEFFYHYFDNVIRGDYNAYHQMLTESFLESEDVPDRFTMQMIYDIEVDQVQSVGSAEYQGETVNVYFFEVKYKIYRNNGTFRNDVASNQSTTQYYHLYSYQGELYLNAVQDKWVVLE